MSKLANREKKIPYRMSSYIETAWCVVILCGMLFAYHIGTHFRTEYGELRNFADKQKILLFIVKILGMGVVGEVLVRKVLLENLLRRIQTRREKSTKADIWRCLWIQALAAGMGTGIILLHTKNMAAVFVQILVAISMNLLIGAIYIRCRNVIFTGILSFLYLLSAYCAIGFYDGIFLKDEISDHYILFVLQIVYGIVASIFVLRKKIFECIIGEKEITYSKIKQAIRTVLFVPVLGICIVVSFATAFYVTYYGFVNPIVQTKPVETELPKSYMIEHENWIDYQRGNECAGYATAYVMRDFGTDCDGHSIYQEFSNTTEDGANLVEIIKYFTKKGMNAKRYYGDLEHLKADLIKGRPVIVLLHDKAVETNINGIKHFSVVVGYDEENIYLADSLKYSGQTVLDEKYYNRVLDIDLFEALWTFDADDTDLTWISNNYIVIEE